MSGRAASLAAAFALAAALCAPHAAEAAARRLAIATGGVTGVNYSIGRALCRLMNADGARTGIRCAAERTRGSGDNLARLRKGAAELAIVQSDAAWHAYRGTGVFAEHGPDRSLRAVLALHREAFTVLVPKGSMVASFAELRGRTLGLGSSGAGPRVTARLLARALGWAEGELRIAENLAGRDLGRALCDGLVEAVAFTVGHPSHLVQEPASTCGARVVPVVGPAIDRLVAGAPYYEPAEIAARLYPGHGAAIPTFATRAMLVAGSQVTASLVYETARATLANLAALRKAHPALAVLKPAEMVTRPGIAPIHDGASRYFTEKGLK